VEERLSACFEFGGVVALVDVRPWWDSSFTGPEAKFEIRVSFSFWGLIGRTRRDRTPQDERINASAVYFANPYLPSALVSSREAQKSQPAMFSDDRLFLWLMTVALPVVEASLPASGLCSLFTFVPFSYGNEPFHSFYCGDCNNVGMSHASAALLAMDHFNARNATVVPELADLGDCPVQFDLNTSRIFDTGTYTHKAAESLLEQLPEIPCAVAGPFHDTPVLELSTLAAALKFPLTAHRAFSIRALANSTSPYTSQVYPDLISSAIVLAQYLFHKGRTDYVALLYGLTETGLYRRETVTIVLDEAGIKNQAFAYNSPLRSPATSEERTIRKALEAVLDSGYRTIVIAPELPTVEI